MRKLLVYLKDYKKEALLAPFFKMLEASFELLVPLVIASMIDRGIGREDRTYLVHMGLVLVGLGIVGLACSMTAQFFSAKAAAGFGAKLRLNLFAHIQGLSFSELDQIGTPTLITRMTSDISLAQTGVNMVLRLFLRSPFIVFGAMGMAFFISREAGRIFGMAILLLSLVIFVIMWVSIPLYQKVQGKLDRILGIARENLSGVRIIRAFHHEKEEIGIFSEENKTLMKRQLSVGKISAFLNPLTFVIINGALVLLLYTGAIQVDAGTLSQGQVVALVNYLSQILLELIKFVGLIFTVTKAVAGGNRIQGILEKENDQKTHGHEALGSLTQLKAWDAPTVEFRNVSLRYKNAGADSLSGISFAVKKGELIGIIGGTGSGKTSLVNLIPRFYDATTGSIQVEGRDLNDYPLASLRKKIAMVAQTALLFQGSIRENLMWGDENASEERLSQALEIAQAKGVVEEKGNGMDSKVSQGGKNFSGGQRQRLSIARALTRKTDILILDDSASALDYATEAKLWKAIRGMEDRPLVFVVSGRVSSLRNLDKILVLDDGKLVGQGSHEQLLMECQVYKEIYESQTSLNLV